MDGSGGGGDYSGQFSERGFVTSFLFIDEADVLKPIWRGTDRLRLKPQKR